MTRFILVSTAFAVACISSPAQAGELWIDYLEERFDICAPVGGDSPFEPRAADFLRDQVYELDKFMPSEESGPSRALDAEGQRSAHFDDARQRRLIAWLDQNHRIALTIFPPLEQHRRVEVGQIETINIRAVHSQLGVPSPHAPLRAAFGKALIGGWPLMDDSGDTTGPALFEFLAARSAAERLLGEPADEPLEAIQSDELLLALERVEASYERLRPLLLGFVDWQGFAPALEMQLWAACLAARENDQ
ncbi:hypothetical protein [Sphingorhabdus sp. SMR4y]|uniref:hypothetical protein n=1 Tax=Sphingorhabdus sp. SMR4y TaxID=2584094 RepID=UPI0011AB4F98|nr:hypothetical protein [Sphingorhabdus sp. SMR4y]